MDVNLSPIPLFFLRQSQWQKSGNCASLRSRQFPLASARSASKQPTPSALLGRRKKSFVGRECCFNHTLLRFFPFDHPSGGVYCLRPHEGNWCLRAHRTESIVSRAGRYLLPQRLECKFRCKHSPTQPINRSTACPSTAHAACMRAHHTGMAHEILRPTVC